MTSGCASPSDAAAIPRHVVYGYLDEPPFGSPGLDGRPIGHDVELAQHVLGAMGVEQVETRLATFADLIPGICDGRWTMTTGLFVTPERSRLVRFSRPIWALPDGLLVRAGNPKQLRSYRDAARDPTVTLGVVEGNVQIETALQAGVPLHRMRHFKRQHDIVAEIVNGRVDAYPSAALVLARLAGSVAGANVEVVELDASPGATSVGAFTFPRHDEAFARVFDEHLKRYLGSEHHVRLTKRHGLAMREIGPILRGGS